MYWIIFFLVVGIMVVVGFIVVVVIDVVMVVNVYLNENCGCCICRIKIIIVVNIKYMNSFYIGICNCFVRYDV